MLQQLQGIDFFLQLRQFLQAEGNVPALTLLLTSAFPLIIGGLIQLLVQFIDVDILSFDALQCLLVLGLVILDLLHQVLIGRDRHLPVILFHLDQPPFSLHQFLVFLQLLLPQGVVVLHQLLHLGLQFIDHLQVLGRVAHLLGVLHQLLDVLLPLLDDLPLRLDLRLQLVDLRVLLLDDALQVHDPFQGHLVGLLALVVLDGLLQALDHLVGVLQLEVLRLEADWVAVLVVLSLELVGCSPVQLLVQADREFLQLPTQSPVLLVEPCGVFDERLGDGRRRRRRRGLRGFGGDGAGDAALLLEADLAALRFLFFAGEVAVRHDLDKQYWVWMIVTESGRSSWKREMLQGMRCNSLKGYVWIDR